MYPDSVIWKFTHQVETKDPASLKALNRVTTKKACHYTHKSGVND